MPVGSTVFVKRPWEEITAIARYCRNEGKSYVLGIQRIPKTQARNRSLGTSAQFNIETRPPATDISPQVPDAPPNLVANRTPLNLSPKFTSPVTAIPVESSRHLQLDSRATSVKTVTPRQTSLSNERRNMPSKWLGMNFRRPKEESANGQSAGDLALAITSSGERGPLGHPSSNGNGKAPAGWQGDLQAPEDVYRAAGIMTPRLGYGIAKIIEMMNSDHIRSLANDAKHSAIMMALDVAGISVDDVLRDAALRQDALNDYEINQRKSFEEHWTRKAEVNAQIQEELDRIKQQNMERIKRNLEEVASEKVQFATWQTMKREEAERIAEAVGLCSISSARRPAASSTLALSATAPGSKSS